MRAHFTAQRAEMVGFPVVFNGRHVLVAFDKQVHLRVFGLVDFVQHAIRFIFRDSGAELFGHGFKVGIGAFFHRNFCNDRNHVLVLY